MNITIENKKQKAIELMQKLDIYKPYIKGFKEKTDVCFFECFGGYWAYQEPELMAKIKEFEEQYNVLVYAVTHEYTDFGECYDFLYISDYHDLYIIENDNEKQFIERVETAVNRHIDLDTGEILTEEEMREFDGDIEEPDDVLAEEKELAKGFEPTAVCKLEEILGDVFIVGV